MLFRSFELIVPIATFLTGTLSGIMLAGNSKEDKEAMLAAQKSAQDNFAETKKVMSAPPVVEKSTPTTSVPVPSFVPQVPQVVTGFGGKEAPLQPPQPER